MPNTVESRFSVASVTRFAPVIENFMRKYPQPVVFDPTPLTVDSFAARVRDAIRSQQENRYSCLPHEITDHLCAIQHNFVVAKQPPYVVLGRRDLVNEYLKQYRQPRKRQSDILQPQDLENPALFEPVEQFHPTETDVEMLFALFVFLDQKKVDYVVLNNKKQDIEKFLVKIEERYQRPFKRFEIIESVDESCIVQLT